MCWQAGFRYSQWLLMLVSGLGLVADAAELLVIPFILPSAEVELCINASQKTWLSKYYAVKLRTTPILMFIYCDYKSVVDRITNCLSFYFVKYGPHCKHFKCKLLILNDRYTCYSA
jgi:hypothetical protein